MIQNHCAHSTTKAPNCGVNGNCLVSCRIYMPALPRNEVQTFPKMKWCRRFPWQQGFCCSLKIHHRTHSLGKSYLIANIYVVALCNSKHQLVKCLNEHKCVPLFRPLNEMEMNIPRSRQVWFFTLSQLLHTVDTLKCHAWWTCHPSSARALYVPIANEDTSISYRQA